MDGGRRPGRRRDATIDDDMFIFADASSLEKLIKMSRGDVGQFSDVLYLKLGVSDLVLRNPFASSPVQRFLVMVGVL